MRHPTRGFVMPRIKVRVMGDEEKESHENKRGTIHLEQAVCI